MKKTPHPKESAAAKAARELAQLQQQVERARAALARLHRDVVEAENFLHLDSTQSARLSLSTSRRGPSPAERSRKAARPRP